MTASATQNSPCLMCSIRSTFLYYVLVNVTCLIWSIQLLLSCQNMRIHVIKCENLGRTQKYMKKTHINLSFLSPFKFTQLEDFLVFSSLYTRLFL